MIKRNDEIVRIDRCMKPIGTSLVLLMVFVVIIILGGCRMETMADRVFLKVGIKTEATELDPALSRELLAKVVINSIYEGLVSLKRDGTIMPATAESWIISEDDKSVVFKLRKDARWSDGKQVTASDFKYSWLRTIKDGERGRGEILKEFIWNAEAYSLGKVDASTVGVQVVDERTLSVRIIKPSYMFLRSLSSWSYLPVRKESVENGPEWDKMPDKVISNGPFKMLAREEGVSLSLARNPHYWNLNRDGIAGIKFIYFENRPEYLKDFNSGYYDMVILSDVMTKKDKYDAQGSVVSYQDLASRFLVVNHRNAILKNKWIRKAISECIDRTKAQEASTLFGRLPSKLYVPGGMDLPGRENGVGPFIMPPDNELARVHLEKGLGELGIGMQDLKEYPLMLAYHNPQELAYLENLASDMEAVLGLSIELKMSDWRTYYKNIRSGQFDMSILGYTADYPYPTVFLELMSSNGFMGRSSGIDDEMFDRMVGQMMLAGDELEMRTFAKEAEDILLDEAHLIPLSHDFYNALVHDNVDGLDYSRITGIDFDHVHLID